MDDLTRVISLATFLPPVTRDSKDVQELMRIENTEEAIRVLENEGIKLLSEKIL